MSDQAAGKEEIVEEDGIVYDYQNANGEVIKREQLDSKPPTQNTPPTQYATTGRKAQTKVQVAKYDDQLM